MFKFVFFYVTIWFRNQTPHLLGEETDALPLFHLYHTSHLWTAFENVASTLRCYSKLYAMQSIAVRPTKPNIFAVDQIWPHITTRTRQKMPENACYYQR